MARLGANRWGKSEIRVSKIHRGDTSDDFSDVTVQVLLQGDVETAHTAGDNRVVLPTDTMRNTVYGLAQEHLGRDLEGFAAILCERFLTRPDIGVATVTVAERRWQRVFETGFVGGGSERRVAKVSVGPGESGTWAGIEGLVVLKTRGSAFTGFPRDEFTILPEATDRVLATSVSANWRYDPVPGDTTEAWEKVRRVLVERFFSDWSASVQHQGWLMGEAVLAAVPEMAEITLHMPNQHHLAFDLTRFGMTDEGVVFQPVSEPYGDISLTVER
ncbi:MAG TPA: urate oxidase [Acidimicrobiia bacterium]|nr:urate oxidase [Acidimicrobiia bacterium]